MTDKKDEEPINVFEYMSKEQTLGLGMVLNSITFSLVAELKDKVFDPLFEEVFPQEFFMMKVKVGKTSIDFGKAVYELFRWVNYATLLYILVRTFSKFIPNPLVFLWMFFPFVFLVIMRAVFVQPVASEGDQITTPEEVSISKSTPSGTLNSPVTDVPVDDPTSDEQPEVAEISVSEFKQTVFGGK